MEKKYVMSWLLSGAMLLSYGTLAADDFAPKEVKFEKASYSKITLSWANSDPSRQIECYKIFRNNVEIGSSTTTSFVDATVLPGFEYVYKVQAVSVGGNVSGFSVEIPVKTMTPINFINSELVIKSTDAMHAMQGDNFNKTALLAGVKASLSALVGENILSEETELAVGELIAAEESAIRAGSDNLTADERLAIQNEIDSLINARYEGASFDQIYIGGKLLDLGEFYFARRNADAAKLCFEYAIKYLKSDPSAVFSILNRQNDIDRWSLSGESSKAVVGEVMLRNINNILRFQDFYQETENEYFKHIAVNLINRNLDKFDQQLSYDDYNSLLYNKLNTVAAWLLTNYSDDAATVAAVEKIKAWELMNLQIELSDENNSSWDGYITVSNITGKINPQLTGWKNFYDERKFQVIDGKVTVPVYVGHNYNLKSNIKKVDGTELEYQLPEFVFGKDMQYVYNYLTDEVSNSTATGAKIKVTINRNNYPFNLVAVKNVDMFELTWQWNDTADFTAKYFKVFRNNLPIKTVAAKSVNLPLLNQDGNCDYFVVAYDAADNPSLASRKFTVVPGDLSEYNEFFNWLEEKFPGQNMTSQDDPDNDGLNNYQEFLEESDPAVASGPLPHLINRGFSSLTLQWSAVPRPDQAGDVMYQVMRNNNLIATVSECEFSDSNLVPGIGYDYKVRAILNNQPLGDWSRKSTVFTQHKHRYTNSELVEQTVDALLLQKFNTTDAGAFINGVRSAFEALSGNSVAFNTVDNGILNSLIANELADISAAEKINSDAERIAAEAALEEYLAKNWGGNQFEAVYINAMLHKLGDIYWDRYSNDKSDVAAFDNAIQLYEFSLNFLKNHAQTTLNTLCGLGQMYLSRLSENSSNAEIMLTLEKNRDYLLSFFVNFSNDQIPESMINPLASIVLTNRKYYHKLFSYDNYESEFYEHEKQLIEYGANTFKTESVLADFRRIINSWALIGVPCNWSGNNGRLVIRNLSTAPEYKFYPLRFELDDVRTFDFDSASELKFYRGHKYEIIFESDVAGGEVFRDKLGSFIFEKPISITYVPGSTPQVTEAALNAESSLNIINSGITFPYNLQAETLPDSFTLNWQFVAPDGYQLQKFNVYRGDNLIGESAVTSLANVPREKYDDGVYAYYVTAVDNSGVESGKSPVLVLTPDFTAEEEAYFAWKQQYFGNNVSLSGDDPDNDGLSNYQEFILGTDPLTASSSALPDISGDKIPGVTVKYFKISLSDFNQFKKINPYREDTVSKICFPVNDGQVLTSGLKNNVAMQASGYFEVPSTGEYNFLLSADDGCQLKINDVVVLEDLYLTDDREISRKVRLRQGINKFEILYFNNSEKSKFELYWGGSDDVMKLFDESNLFTLSEDNARKMQCYIALKRDSDWDGLVDHEELLLGSDHLNGDSDNDGLSDYDEVKIYHSDPVNPDTNGNGISDGEEVKLSGGSVLPENMHFADLKTINATEYTGVVGFWSPQDTAMRCIQRRGKLSYKVDFPASGIYKFDFLVGGINKNGTRSKVNFKLDGVEIHSITSPDSIIEKNVSVYTPYLLTGEHIITLEWDNNLPGQEFLLRQIKIGQLNNTADNSSPSTVSKTISEQIVANRNIVKNGARYRVSPASIIGESRYPELVRFNNQSVHKIGENLWYADLELNANAPIEYQLSCENIIFSDNSSAIWTPTNPALENGKKLNLRQGDSLLFTVVDGEAESWVITVNEEVINGTGSEKVPYKFEQRGIYHLIAKTFDGNGVNKKIYSMEIEVSDYKFKQDDMVCWVGYAREWLIPFLPDYIDYKRDLRYTSAVLYPGTNEAVVKTFIDSNKVRYNYAVLKNDEEPLIADVQKISGVGIYSSNYTGVYNLTANENYPIPDTYNVVEMVVVMSPLRSDVTLRLNIFVPGITFEDGTIDKELTVEDFSENGIALVRFIRPKDSGTSICHKFKVYQNNEYIGLRL